MAGFAQDVRGTTLGWRQSVGVFALVAAVVGLVPLVPAMVSGRWELEPDERSALLSLLPAPPEGAQTRVLWIGAPEDVPVPGWPLADGMIYALADEEAATLRERWRAEPTRAEQMVADDIDLAATSATDRLGRLLGPMGVRFVLVPVSAASSTLDGASAASEGEGQDRPALLDSLDRQLDLRRVELGDDSLVAYENTAWLPVRADAAGAVARGQPAGRGRGARPLRLQRRRSGVAGTAADSRCRPGAGRVRPACPRPSTSAGS